LGFFFTLTGGWNGYREDKPGTDCPLGFFIYATTDVFEYKILLTLHVGVLSLAVWLLPEANHIPRVHDDSGNVGTFCPLEYMVQQ
jgi:hypothetical protein